jgi:hypothetical protein
MRGRGDRPPEQNYIALAGEFFVLGELASRGLDGTLTLGTAKEIDVLVLNRRTGRTFRVEVKTTKRRMRRSECFGPHYGWLMHERHGRLTGDDLVYVFVVLTDDPAGRRFFLVPAADVATYIPWQQKRYEAHTNRPGAGRATSMRMFRVPAVETPMAAHLPREWADGRWRRWASDWQIFERVAGEVTVPRL